MENEKTPKKPKNQLKNLAALSGVAFQMGITIYLFVMLGKWLDTKYTDGGKLFLIVGTLLGVGISLYVVLKQINKLNE
ncbi:MULTISPECIES: AtpZ/AtpI family protein [Mangrovimonas]|uniref:AtpZ/AtpI family protein n=1 Tax=Mangrovimonas TaxID=1211036 RepID=UPI0009779337|nr:MULTISPECIES: AtpZ/AtpI family protein [Mangrovimonas]OMP32185.1 hypothetical protein BKM32_03795 [Mangrovimonas sp. DI 80]